MPDELAVADIQQGFLEYRANFGEPITAFWFSGRHGELVDAVHKALTPWNLGLQNISWNQQAKNVAEAQLTFSFPFPPLSTTIQVSPAGITIFAFNMAWEMAGVLVPLCQAAVDALKAAVAQELQSQLVTLGFHVKPGNRQFKEVLSQFVNTKALGAEDATMYGVSMYSGDYSFVIDGSGIVPGGVFIKLIRTFAAKTGFSEIAEYLYKDEVTVLQRLGLKLK